MASRPHLNLPNVLIHLIMEYWELDPSALPEKADAPLDLQSVHPLFARKCTEIFKRRFEAAPLQTQFRVLETPQRRMKWTHLLEKVSWATANTDEFVYVKLQETALSPQRYSTTVTPERETFEPIMQNYIQRANELAQPPSEIPLIAAPYTPKVLQTHFMSRAYIAIEAQTLLDQLMWACHHVKIHLLGSELATPWSDLFIQLKQAYYRLNESIMHSSLHLLGRPFVNRGLSVYASASVQTADGPTELNHFILSFDASSDDIHDMHSKLYITRHQDTLRVLCQMREPLEQVDPFYRAWKITWNWLAVFGILLPLWKRETWSRTLSIALLNTTPDRDPHTLEIPYWIFAALGFRHSFKPFSACERLVPPRRPQPDALEHHSLWGFLHWQAFQRTGRLPSSLEIQLQHIREGEVFTLKSDALLPFDISRTFPTMETLTTTAQVRGRLLLPQCAWDLGSSPSFFPWPTLNDASLVLRHPKRVAKLFQSLV